MTQVKLFNSDLCALIDICDLDRVAPYRWALSKRKNCTYACATINGKQVLMHRFLMEEQDRRVHIDHVNGNGLDNRSSNLRRCSASENNLNRPSYKNNALGIKGVKLVERGRYMARITRDGLLTYLGTFDSAEDAALAYDSAAKILHGKFARLNYSN